MRQVGPQVSRMLERARDGRIGGAGGRRRRKGLSIGRNWRGLECGMC